ncbi:autotransporter outer membrane beta-barrel domain-containing protein [Zophobihabitans entericus]|uniref:Autotransporter outer membrane beta-barrel domain-containing protein n=1 Tax=Zophobihabitans entericus TaxID=1635327 RepID=A0A6G9IAN5_9GAMM|nr:autotransporter outer membrane beta-barrel domain-containing protein [Zophobihabitans entericus]QIQ20897.1 autotransporter outer membrane beta-barrel domain-containing protein [Zophobihabitans entericus]
MFKFNIITTVMLTCFAGQVYAACQPLSSPNSGFTADSSSNCTADSTTYTGAVGQGGSILTSTGVGTILDATNVTSITDTDSTTTTMGVNAKQGGVINLGTATITVSSNTTWSSGFGGVVASGAGSKINASGNLTVSTIGGGAYSYNEALRAEAGGSIVVDGNTILSTKGDSSSGVKSIGTGSTVQLNNVKATMSGDGSGSSGLHAENGGTITAKQIDITLDGAKQSYSYGLLADISAQAKIVIDGGKITQTVGSGGNILNNKSNSAVRVLDGANITVNNTLDIITNGMGARGVYVSENGTVDLNNTNIQTKGMSAAGIQIGKSRVIGTGPGIVNSTGHLKVETTNATSAAIYVEGMDSALNADSATSSAEINSASYAIMYGGSSTTTDQDSKSTISLNNATINTSHASRDLIFVGGRNIGSSLNLTNSQAKAGTGGWLINVTDLQTTDTMAPSSSVHVTPSEFTFTNSKTVLTGSMTKDASSQLTVNLNDNSIWNVAGRNGNTSEISTLTALNLNNSTINAYAGGLANYTIKAPITNTNGTINLSDAVAGDILTIDGNYTGADGLLVLDTALDGDSSVTDKLVITGDTSGTTRVKVVNAGGDGALTTDGIEIISVGGNSAGTFVQDGRIVAGAFDYFLRSGNDLTNVDPNNWYLISQYSPTTNPDRVYRPEAGSYLANLAAANTLFTTQLHDRLGETQYIDVFTGEKKQTSMWLRQIGGHNNFQDGSEQLKTMSNRYVVQLGGDIAQWSNDGLDRWHLGMMFGYANNQSKTYSKVTNFASTGKVFGYSAGLYGTWYANEEDKTGAYFDSWILYNWFDNQVKGERIENESYKSKGFTASLEGGYSFKLAQQDEFSYWLQPKAQIVWMDVNASNHNEKNGTSVEDDTSNNIMTRLGLRAYISKDTSIENGEPRNFQPFIEASWIYNSKDFAVKMNNVENRQRGTRNMAEIKIGMEGQVNSKFNIWGNVTQQFGDNSYRDTQILMGVKYNF